MKDRKKDAEEFRRLAELIDTLRSENGCPWDRKQKLEDTRAYILEETYELIEAMAELNYEKIREELGDVLFQCLFIAKILEDEQGEDLSRIIDSNIRKMINRHPHIFSDADFKDEKELLENWEYVKKNEKREKSSIFSNIVKTLPSLSFARKVQEKASRVGFDWEMADGPADKVREEFEEFISAKDSVPDNKEKAQEEFGDILFSMVNLSRFYGIDSELALRGSVSKFIERFCNMEMLIEKDDRHLRELSQDEMDEYWEKSKESLRSNSKKQK